MGQDGGGGEGESLVAAVGNDGVGHGMEGGQVLDDPVSLRVAAREHSLRRKGGVCGRRPRVPPSFKTLGLRRVFAEEGGQPSVDGRGGLEPSLQVIGVDYSDVLPDALCHASFGRLGRPLLPRNPGVFAFPAAGGHKHEGGRGRVDVAGVVGPFFVVGLGLGTRLADPHLPDREA